MAEPARKENRATWLIFVIAFLNTAGMTIVLPVLPFLAQKYTHNANAVALWVGILVSAYSLCALLAAPALGAFSDRVGRKPVLLISLLGSAVGFVVFGIGGAMWVLMLGRIIDGLTAGNISTIFAYIADVTSPEDRARKLGMTGAITGIGFMLGPALGGFLAKYGLSAPVYVAAAITFVTAILVAIVLPESLDEAHRTERFQLADAHPFKTIGEALRRPNLRPLLLIILFMTIPMVGLQSNVSVFGKDVLGWGPGQVGALLFCVGIIDIAVQGGLLRLLLPRIGERGVVLTGLIGQAAGYAVIALVGALLHLPWLFVAGALLFSASEGGTGPALHGLISNAVSHREQGWVMGGAQSMNSAARVIGPLIAGLLYSAVGQSAPYWFGLVVVLAVIVMALPLLRGASPSEPELVTDTR